MQAHASRSGGGGEAPWLSKAVWETPSTPRPYKRNLKSNLQNILSGRKLQPDRGRGAWSGYYPMASMLRQQSLARFYMELILALVLKMPERPVQMASQSNTYRGDVGVRSNARAR